MAIAKILKPIKTLIAPSPPTKPDRLFSTSNNDRPFITNNPDRLFPHQTAIAPQHPIAHFPHQTAITPHHPTPDRLNLNIKQRSLKRSKSCFQVGL